MQCPPFPWPPAFTGNLLTLVSFFMYYVPASKARELAKLALLPNLYCRAGGVKQVESLPLMQQSSQVFQSVAAPSQGGWQSDLVSISFSCRCSCLSCSYFSPGQCAAALRPVTSWKASVLYGYGNHGTSSIETWCFQQISALLPPSGLEQPLPTLSCSNDHHTQYYAVLSVRRLSRQFTYSWVYMHLYLQI